MKDRKALSLALCFLIFFASGVSAQQGPGGEKEEKKEAVTEKKETGKKAEKAKEGKKETVKKPSAHTEAMIKLSQTYWDVSGDGGRFRQDMDGVLPDVTGGLEDSFFRYRQGKIDIETSARAMYEHDYDAYIKATKADLGFVEVSFTTFRHYYDGGNEFWNPETFAFPVGDMELDDGGIYTDRTNFAVNVGLTLPELPTVTFGYERFEREGRILNLWGSQVRGPGPDRNRSYPVDKRIDGATDTFRIGVDHTIAKKVDISLNQEWENYNDHTYISEHRYRNGALEQQREWVGFPQYDRSTTTAEISSHISDKLFGTIGYMFDRVTSEETFFQNRRVKPIDYDEFLDSSHKGRNYAHVWDIGGIFDPMPDLRISSGLRVEAASNAGWSHAREPSGPASGGGWKYNETNIRDVAFGENILITYRGIPKTTLNLEGEWEQRQVQWYERSQTQNRPERSYMRDTDIDWNTGTYTVSANFRPINTLDLSTRYRRINARRDYSDGVDTGVFFLGNAFPLPNGYPGYIEDRNIFTNEYTFGAKWKPMPGLSLIGKYQFYDKRYDIPKELPNDIITTVEGHRFTGGFVVAPIQNTLVSAMFSTENVDARNPAVVYPPAVLYDYSANIHSANVDVTYLFNTRTSLSAGFNDWWTSGTVDTSSMDVYAGVKHRITDWAEIGVKYMFTDFEDHRKGADDYVDHGVYTSLTLDW